MAAPPRPIAACLCGQVRTFVRRDVRINIHRSMIAPIRDETDVFASFSFVWNDTASMTDGYARIGILYNRGAENATVVSVGHWLQTLFEVQPGDFEPRAETASGLTFGRLKRLSTLPSSPALTAHTTCLDLVLRKERARGLPYTWVMRLRSDVVHAVPLPPYRLWPRFADGRKVVYSPSCHGNTTAAPWQVDCGHAPATAGRACSRFSYRRYWPYSDESEASTQHGASSSTAAPPLALALGCVSDLWALTTRSAADVYFNKTLLLNAVAVAAERRLTCGNSLWWNECFLGCALHAHDVEVREVSASGQSRAPPKLVSLCREHPGGTGASVINASTMSLRLIRSYGENRTWRHRVGPPQAGVFVGLV